MFAWLDCVKHKIEEIAKIIGADSLGYLSIEHARQMAEGSGTVCTSCFSGEYPTQIPDGAGKDRFEKIQTEE